MSTELQRFLRSNTRGRSLGPRDGFTLVEVLAALLFMAILIPVTLQGVSVSSRAGLLGQRKSAAMRIAERVLEEQIITGRVSNGAANGTLIDGDVSYPWTMKTEPWTEDSMTQVVVQVSFDVQGSTFEVSARTLYDETASNLTTTTSVVSP